MAKEIIRSDAVPASPYFSQAVKAGSTIYLSGIVGTDPVTKQLAGPTIKEQTRQSIENCRSILRAAGSDLDDVVDVQVLLTRPEDSLPSTRCGRRSSLRTRRPARRVSSASRCRTCWSRSR